MCLNKSKYERDILINVFEEIKKILAFLIRVFELFKGTTKVTRFIIRVFDFFKEIAKITTVLENFLVFTTQRLFDWNTLNIFRQ